MLDFKNYPKIPRYKNLHVRITQKLDGTNGLIAIEKMDKVCDSDYCGCGECDTHLKFDGHYYDFKAGSRNQWLPSPEEIEQRQGEIQGWKDNYRGGVLGKTLDDPKLIKKLKPEKLHDNHGFSKWAHENKEVLIRFLGEGYHYGEWCGKGIQNGEGLKEKGFYLFSSRERYYEFWPGYPKMVHEDTSLSEIVEPLPKRLKEVPKIGLHFVPELYNDKLEDLDSFGCHPADLGNLINKYVCELILNGSKVGDSSVKPEGLIVELNMNTKFKIVINESEKDKRG